MGSPEILVVGETPSLGQAIADLLEAAGFPTRLVPSVRGVAPGGFGEGSYRVVVAACNASDCFTALAWGRGDFPRTSLVVVGSRYPAAEPAPNVHVIRLPLQPAHLVAVVRSLLTPGSGGPAAASGEPDR
jgi:hypothetical protein